MASFNGRRGPNVSQYLAHLNTLPEAQDISQDINLADGSLDFLTNTEFFDFDQFNPNSAFEQQQSQHPLSATAHPDDAHKDEHYQFSEFPAYPQSGIIMSPALSPELHGLQGTYPSQGSQFAASPTAGDKRKASVALPLTADLEESSRLAAEEDKRRRNTAASARFRVKKKQREQALEKQAKEMTDKVQQLESKVQQLEMENKWLKGLITEKSDTKAKDAPSKVKSEQSAEGRITEKRNDGVGTSPVAVAETS